MLHPQGGHQRDPENATRRGVSQPEVRMQNKEKAGMMVRVLEFLEEDPCGLEKLQEFLNQQGRRTQTGERSEDESGTRDR